MAAESKKKSRLTRLLRFLVTWGSVIYVVALACLLYELENCTEKQWYLSPLLYLPPQGWLLPLVVLAPLAFILRPAMLVFHIGAALGLFLVYMHFHAVPENIQAPTPDEIITVITVNIGQRKTKTLEPFIEEMEAEVIAFQEALLNQKAFRLENPLYTTRIEGEFSLASKLPIRSSGIVPDLTFDGRPVAAWFELLYHGKPFVLYSVHMPTPRAYLNDLRGKGFLAEAERGGGLYSSDIRAEYQYYWTNRFALARDLLAVLQKDSRPKIMVGDFNTPDHGGVYQMLAAAFTDAFAATGKGYGETFPGTADHMLLTNFRPWLRLDYQFADEHWQPVECVVEPQKRAQHLAVMASYQFIDGK